MNRPLITMDSIAVRLRDRWLLAGSSWQINTGEQWAVTGPNGAGKTTLVKAAAGLLPVVQGKIHYHALGGIPPVDAFAYVASDARRELWRQEHVLNQGRGFAGRFNDSTTIRDLIVHNHVERLPPTDMNARLDDIAGRFKLESLLDKSVLAISTGEMSRVLLARALVRRPKMLFLDEPFDGLDRSGRQELMAMLDGLAASGLPIVLVAHRPEEMLSATTHVLAIDRGRIISAQPVNRDSHQAFSTAVTAPVQETMCRPQHSRLVRERFRPFSPDTLIDMNAVTVRYGDTVVLDRLTWAVMEGQHWAVVGPNGAGKTTMLKLITGECLQVFGNRVRLFGKHRGAEQSLWEIRKRLGVVSHDLAAGYQKRVSAMEVVCSGFFDSVGLYRHCDPGQIKTARRWLEQMGISALANVPFNHLSLGQRQLVLITRAMVKSPRLLILDEPCAGLDMENRRRVLGVVDDIASGETTGLIFISHHEKEIPRSTTHRLLLDHGVVVDSGPIRKR